MKGKDKFEGQRDFDGNSAATFTPHKSLVYGRVTECPNFMKYKDGQPESGQIDRPYFPHLDGLRAFSILAVLAFHAWLPVFKGGHIGVDIFFVISGYLITLLLVREFDSNGRVSFSKFYLRRIFRIWPALFVVIGAANLLYFAGLNKLLGPVPSETNLYAWTMLTNIQGSYGGSAGGLHHLWSVAQEEQFYLIWPAILTGVLYLSTNKSFAVIAVGCATLLLFSLSLMSAENFPHLIALYVTNHASLLLLGSFGGLVKARYKLPTLDIGNLFRNGIEIASLLILVALTQITSLDPRLNVAIVGLSVLVLILSLGTASFASLVLSSAPATYIGKRSYSLYLWHWLIQYAIVEAGMKGPIKTATYILLVPIFSLASYRFIEQPLVRFKNRRFEPKLVSIVSN